MSKVIAIGEALIDFIPAQKGKPISEVTSFLKRAGGAPANVACQVARLGGEAVFLGAFATDGFGRYLQDELESNNVKCNAHYTKEANTSLAFVTLAENGEREFNFFRNPGADMMLPPEFVTVGMFDKGDILHFCSVCLCPCLTEQAHKKAIILAKSKGALISFDVNIRLPLWENEDSLKAAVNKYLAYADILKLSEEELSFLTGENDEDEAIRIVLETAKNVKALFITRGSKGATCIVPGYYRIDNHNIKEVAAVDSTGAGDSYIGCFLYKAAKEGFSIDKDWLMKAMDFAAAGAMLTVLKKGAIEAMPKLNDINKILNNKN